MNPQASLFISKNPHKVHQQSIGRTTHIQPSIVILIMDLTVRMFLLVIPDKRDQENQCWTNNNYRSYECDSIYKRSLFVNTSSPNQINAFHTLDYEVFAH